MPHCTTLRRTNPLLYGMAVCYAALFLLVGLDLLGELHRWLDWPSTAALARSRGEAWALAQIGTAVALIYCATWRSRVLRFVWVAAAVICAGWTISAIYAWQTSPAPPVALFAWGCLTTMALLAVGAPRTTNGTRPR